MKIALYLAIGCGMLAATPTQAKPQDKSQQNKSIVIVGERMTFPQWSKRMTNVLESRMNYPSYLTRATPREGVVRVSFLCGDNGKPTAVTLRDSSGFREIDNAALRAVKQIPTLHPLAEGLDHGQRYQAVLLFAKDQSSYDRQVAAIRDDADRRNAWFGNRSAQVAMGVSLMPPVG
ncbi:TonB family protein [Sphingomonas sp. SUN019]|uniref:TonB family protein n=1 Tax=Sphingomonas sp. SUN019 TaxID=2937788 RepID=UPI0021641EF1|nr:TonB family protein [Sphingomonas sp. SUN019]UVO50126.1 TonB family protein [Sphingomonas sp. SUN019]